MQRKSPQAKQSTIANGWMFSQVNLGHGLSIPPPHQTIEFGRIKGRANLTEQNVDAEGEYSIVFGEEECNRK